MSAKCSKLEELGPLIPPTQSRPEQPITKQVRVLESRCHKITRLLKHILATLMLEGNQHLFAQMPEDWHLLVKSWYEEHQRLADVVA